MRDTLFSERGAIESEFSFRHNTGCMRYSKHFGVQCIRGCGARFAEASAGLLVQGLADEELPEQVRGCTGLHRPVL